MNPLNPVVIRFPTQNLNQNLGSNQIRVRFV